MKQIILKLFCMALCMCSIKAFALEITLNEIKYALNVNSRTAEVTGSSLKNVVVPETICYDDVTYTVTKICDGAFIWNEEIVSIKTGNTIKTLGEDAFYSAKNLQKVDFGNSLEIIESGCFGKCANLKYLVIPHSIKYIDSATDTFSGCGATIICLKEGQISYQFLSQTMYPSSFFTFSENKTDYNGKVPEVNYTFNGIGFGFQPTAVKLDALVTTAGNQTSDITFTIANDDMSFDVDIPYTYTINPVTLKAKVSDASRQYGETNPQFTTTYSGFVNNEDASVVTNNGSYSTTATAKSDVGTYAITQTGATAQNYVFEYEDGTLTISKAPLTMTANDKTIAYGDKMPTLDVKYEGLKNNETQPAWSLEPSLSTTATSASNVGKYPITISNAEAKNYTLTVNNGTMTIEKANLTISADNKSKKYGEANPEFTLSYIGLKNNEIVPEWETPPTIETSANQNSSAGKYPISIKNAVAKNYSIIATEGTLTINKVELQVTTNNVQRKYGEENPSFELSYEGFVNDENENILVSKPKATTEATTYSDVGTYDIVISNGVSENYDFKYIGGKLTIEKADQTLTWNQNFNGITQYDQIELTASASSGLDVTYTIEGSQICYINKIGNNQYLDSYGEGEAVITAIQEGNNNYWPSSKIYIPIVIDAKPDNADFVRNGILYKYLSYNTIEVVGASRNTVNLTIPGSVSYNGSTYHVKSIAEEAFHQNSTIESVVLPNSITSIGEIAFGACSNLKSISIPNSVTEIGDGTFYGCESLTSISIPDGIMKIGGSMFWGCVDLTEVSISNSVTTICEEAFRECLTLGSIKIPSKVTVIDDKAFQGCSNLTDVYCLAETVPVTANSVFDGAPMESATLHVPASVIEIYKATWPWRNFKAIVAIGDANGDGVVDDDDINALSDYITKGKIDGLNLKNADINDDQKINVADIVSLVKIIMATKK